MLQCNPLKIYRKRLSDNVGQPPPLMSYKRRLLLLMTILAKTLLTLVRSHLMTLVLLSVWHNCIILNGLYKLLNLTCEALSGLESRNIVLGDSDCSVLRDVTSNLSSALLDDEATKTTEIYILTLDHSALNALHECLNDSLYLDLLNASRLRNLVYDIGLCHSCNEIYFSLFITVCYLIFCSKKIRFGKKCPQI